MATIIFQKSDFDNSAKELFTLTAEGEQFLLHVKDIGNLDIRDTAAGKSDLATCGNWKDRKAKVEFTPAPDGAAFGEVKSIAFQ